MNRGSLRDRNWRPEGGGVNGSRSKFLSKLIRRPISQNHHEPSRVLGEVWNSYGRAKPTQNTPRTCKRKHRSERENLQTWQTRTGQTALSNWSDWSGWNSKNPNRSDRFQRPVRPVPSRQPATKAPNGKSRANEVQIQWNLEDSFASTPWTYPQNIFPKRLTDREKIWEDQRKLGFSQEPKNPNSWELAIPAGFALSRVGRNWAAVA